MFRWCAYCQKFIGESPPHDDFSITHGICLPCMRTVHFVKPERLDRMRAMGAFLQKVWHMALNMDVAKATDLLGSAAAMGIRPVDFLICVVGPLAGKADRQFASGALPAELQQTINTFCTALIASVHRSLPPTTLERPDVLLMTVHGNQHNFALPLLELWLRGEAISALSVPDGVSAESAFALYEKHLPKVVGFSLGMKEQISAVRECVDRIIDGEKYPPLILVGGLAVKAGTVTRGDLPRTTLICDEESLFATLKNHLALGFLYDLKRKTAGKQTVKS